jgi:hypothetical protein
VLQQQLVFGDIEPARFRLTEAELGQRLADQFIAALTHSRLTPDGRRKFERPKISRPKKIVPNAR